MNKGYKILLLSITTLMLSSCAMLSDETDVVVTTEPMLTMPEDENASDRVKSEDSVDVDILDGDGLKLGDNIIYFEYDEYSVTDSKSKAIIKMYADYMKEHPNAEKGIGLIYFTGPTMGYLIGFLVATFLAGLFTIQKNKNLNVTIEGHADERGSRAYNLALGEKRSNAVKDIFLLNNISPEGIDLISYGEEKLAVAASDEESHSLNRRVEIIFLNTGK